MNAIERLIIKARKEDSKFSLEQLEANIKEKAAMEQKHDQRLEFIKNEMGAAWIELEPYSKLISMDAYDSLYKIRAMDLKLKPFSILCTSRGCQSTEKSFQLEFRDEKNLRGWELERYLLRMREDFPEWKKEQRFNSRKLVAGKKYEYAYRDWIDNYKMVSDQNQVLANNKQIEIDNPFHLWRLRYNSGTDGCYVLDDEPGKDGYWRVWGRRGHKRIRIYTPGSLEDLGEIELVVDVFKEDSKGCSLSVHGCRLIYGPDTDADELRAWMVKTLTPEPEKPEKPEILDYEDIELIQDKSHRELDSE